MEEYGVTESWTKVYDIDFRVPLLGVFGNFHTVNELLVSVADQNGEGSNIMSFDLKKGSYFTYHGKVFSSELVLYNYVETLALMDGFPTGSGSFSEKKDKSRSFCGGFCGRPECQQRHGGGNRDRVGGGVGAGGLVVSGVGGGCDGDGVATGLGVKS